MPLNINHLKAKLINIILFFIFFFIGISLVFLNTSFFQTKMVECYQYILISNLNVNKINKNNTIKANFNGDSTKYANGLTFLNNTIQIFKDSNKIPTIGIIDIPKLHTINPIIKGYGNEGNYLAMGACTMKPNQVMGSGNYALAAHYMDDNFLFHSIKNIKKEDSIYLTDFNKIYIYKKINSYIVNRSQNNVLNNTSQPILTLITCINSHSTPKRLIVQCKLTKIIPYK